MKPLRIAMLAHSTNPRGGVVHALELSEALHALGHRVTLHAPDEAGRGFFRATRCAAVSVPASPVSGGVAALVRQRMADYLAHFDRVGTEGFDVWHAQDAISANALATLVAQGRIGGFVRTVHHLDRFDDPQVMALQERAHRSAALVLCVSRQWRETLAREHGIEAHQVANGVDLRRYRSVARAPAPTPMQPIDPSQDAALAARLGPRDGPVLLAVGGIEARKNTLAILQAFIALRASQAAVQPASQPKAQLVIAGGASLLDHSACRTAFDAALRASGLRAAHGLAPRDPRADVIVTGPLPDADMPSLYRAADVLLFPSLKEGFGLVVLEALACGTPVVVSRIAPFTEHLHDGMVSWCDPQDAASIARAAQRALDPAAAASMCAAAAPLLARYGWAASAARHVALYEQFLGRMPRAQHQETLHA